MFGDAVMSKKSDQNLLVGLDIGTSKVVAIVADLTPEGEIDIIGIGSHPSRGLKKGVVVNIESTVQSIQRAIEDRILSNPKLAVLLKIHPDADYGMMIGCLDELRLAHANKVSLKTAKK